MVIISTSAIEVSIHAVSPESSFGAAGAPAGAAAAAAGAVGAGACATAESVSNSIIDVANISRCKTRYTDFISFLQETIGAGANRLLIHEPDAFALRTKNRANRPGAATLVWSPPTAARSPIIRRGKPACRGCGRTS